MEECMEDCCEVSLATNPELKRQLIRCTALPGAAGR